MVGLGSLERTLLSLAWPGGWESVIEDIQGVSARRVLISRLNFLNFLRSGGGIVAGGLAAHHLTVEGAPEGFLAAWARNRGRFPIGVDVILCAGDRLAALPRRTAITEG